MYRPYKPTAKYPYPAVMVPLLKTKPVISKRTQLTKQNANPDETGAVKLTYLISSPVMERSTPKPAPRPTRMLKTGPAKHACNKKYELE